MLTKIAWRNIWRNRGRSLITITAVLFCVFFAIVLRSMQLGSYQNVIDDMIGNVNGYIQVHTDGYWDDQILDNAMMVDESVVATISNTKGVEKVAKRLESYSLVSSGVTTKVLGVIGIEPLNELPGYKLENRLVSGTIFKDNKGIVLGEGAANYFNKTVGDTLILIGQGYHGQSANGLFPIVGIVKMRNPEMDKNLAFLHLNEAQNLFAAQGLATSYVVETKNRVDYTKLAQEIGEKLPEGYESLTFEQMMPELIQALLADNVGGIIMLGVLYLIIGFVLLGTIIMMTAERIKEFGILISVGMQRLKLVSTTVLENLFLALLGAIGGFLLAIPLQWYYSQNPIRLTGAMEEVMAESGYEPIMKFAMDLSINFTHTFLIVAITMMVGLYAVVKILTLKPVIAMRG